MTTSASAKPVSMDPATLSTLTVESQAWAARNALLMGVGGDASPSHLVHAPFSLLPSPLPRSAYEQGVALAEINNRMVENIASDEEYLRQTLKEVCKSDDFTRRLMEIFEATRTEAARDDAVLAVLRSDYMLDEPTGGLLQVELNTIASSFGCLSTMVARMHKHLVEFAGLQGEITMDDLPENSALDAISEALAAAVRAPAAGGDDGAMLMVVQPGERNAFDQQWLQAKLWDSHRIRTIRKSLAEVAECATTDASGGLWIVGQRVTVAYFRAGYTPTDYPSEKEWEGRLLLEKSSAIKCPNMAYHLAGTKKVQQDLTRPGVLERFLPPEDAAAMRGSFTGLWGWRRAWTRAWRRRWRWHWRTRGRSC